jgi:spore coat protein H
MKNLRHLLAAALLLAGPAVLPPALHAVPPAKGAAPKPDKNAKHRKDAADFFAGMIPRLKIELSPEQRDKLQKDARNYAEATLTETTLAGPVLYQKVAIKLKGSAGSFQQLDGKPGMTLSFDKGKGGERFHGMTKIHLNNGAQDGTYLNELIAGEMGRRAGVPASRCSHAFVELNGRDLGLYVVKEAFTKDFLAAFFKNNDGDLYDGGFCAEINENTEKDMGDPNDKAGIKELIAASQEPDNAKRWERLGKILDIEKFISFCVLEDIVCHWDGYNFNRNNYRFYRDPDSGKFSFFLHGMDQVFGDENFPVMRGWDALVGGAVMRCPQGAAIYRARFDYLYQNLLVKEDWSARITTEGRRVRDAIAVKDGRWAKEYENQINEARGKVARRITAIGKQLGVPVKPVVFDAKGALKVGPGWTFQGTEGGQGDEVKIENRDCLRLVATGTAAPSWRQTVQLEAGKYRFEAVARTQGVAATDDEKGKGAGLRVSGLQKRANAMEGDTAWQTLSYEFETGGGDVPLVAELRASKGEVWFLRDSFKIIRGK